ncbi:MAG: A24 family peptidase [Candidatus Dehalobacter alkaniphilus]
MTEQLFYIIPILMLLISTITDWRRRKIYNWITLPGILLGIFFIVGFHKFSVTFLFSYISMFFILMIVYSQKAMRGGDAKLLLALSLYLPPAGVFLNLAICMFSAFFYFFIRTIKLKGLAGTFTDVRADTISLLVLGENSNNFTNEKAEFPGGGAVLIAISFIVTLFLSHLFGNLI